MALSKHVRTRVRVLVKAFPQHSDKYEETVCCAGVTDDDRLIRLYPITYRRLAPEHQFNRFDLVEAELTKASNDARPESYRVNHDSIKVIERGTELSDESKVRVWQPFIAPSLKRLHEDNRSNNRSLGIIRPDAGSLKFLAKPAKDADAEDRKLAEQVHHLQQSSFLEDPLTPLEKSEFSFAYRYTSDGKKHEHVIHDWEVQEAHRQYKRKYKADAMEHLSRMYGETIPARNLHFIMGTMAAHPRTFIVIGLLRSGLDPAELDKQGKLF
jgi:hypothetical protein